MRRFQSIIIHLSAMFLLAVLTSSCASTAYVPASSASLAESQRVVLDGQATSAQKKQIQADAGARFGGFKGMAWGRSGVSGLIVVAVNGQFGPNHYYDSSGSYNGTWDGSFSIVAAPGDLKILGKPNHYQIPGNRGNALSFRAKPGHHYFVGTVMEETGGQIRWLPVVYDKTEGKVVPISGADPQTSPKPVTVTIYI